MITKNEIKRIKSLQNKKDRKELQLFVAEGEKTVRDLLKSGWVSPKVSMLHNLLEMWRKN